MTGPGVGEPGVGLFGRDVASLGQRAALTARLPAEHDDVLVAIDEEDGDVIRPEAGTGSSFPGVDTGPIALTAAGGRRPWRPSSVTSTATSG